MKNSRRNKERQAAKQAKFKGGKPALSKFARKHRLEPGETAMGAALKLAGVKTEKADV